MTLFTTVLTTLLFITSVALQVYASPAVHPQEFEVYDPVITSPSAGIVWNIGSTQKITWNTSRIPKGNPNITGLVLLGHPDRNSENLNISSPLASGFPLEAGEINVTVPEVPFRKNYVVVLFGDSGNISPQFTINHHTKT